MALTDASYRSLHVMELLSMIISFLKDHAIPVCLGHAQFLVSLFHCLSLFIEHCMCCMGDSVVLWDISA